MNKKIIISTIILLILGVTGVVFWGRMKGENNNIVKNTGALDLNSNIATQVDIAKKVTGIDDPDQVLKIISEKLKKGDVEGAQVFVTDQKEFSILVIALGTERFSKNLADAHQTYMRDAEAQYQVIDNFSDGYPYLGAINLGKTFEGWKINQLLFVSVPKKKLAEWKEAGIVSSIPVEANYPECSSPEKRAASLQKSVERGNIDEIVKNFDVNARMKQRFNFNRDKEYSTEFAKILKTLKLVKKDGNSATYVYTFTDENGVALSGDIYMHTDEEGCWVISGGL